MLKNYIIVDNFFDDPFKYQTIAKNMEYWLKDCTVKNIKVNNKEDIYGTKNSDWKGARTDPFHIVNNDLHCEIFSLIFKKLFNSLHSFDFEYQALSYFHFTPETILLGNQNKWHSDYRALLAGVIYLNETPKIDCGTSLKNNNNIINIKNKFNRLLVYQSNIIHAPSGFFGDSLDNARLTLTFFVKKIMLNSH
jgi:hypothetical protein